MQDHIGGSGIWWIALALLTLAVFPGLIYLFFRLIILELKSKALTDDMTSLGAFKQKAINQQWENEEAVKTDMRVRYQFFRFVWPLSLLVFFNCVCFSIIWDIIRLNFDCSGTTVALLYSSKLLNAAELPMMAFLGVVIFNYGHLLRRLYVWDITTHVFWNALQRTWLVVGVAVVLAISMSFANDSKVDAVTGWVHWHAAFFGLGFVVNPVLQSLMERAQKGFQAKRPSVGELPLSLVQGISFWHEYRLGEEGIENVQNLATCDVIDLAITTRYNLRTLLDWVDQAILIHRMGEKAVKLREAGFISGAIDMAWAAPQNSGDDDDELPKQIAKTLEVEHIYIVTLMNSLYQDTQVHMIWDLWQSELDSNKKGKP